MSCHCPRPDVVLNETVPFCLGCGEVAGLPHLRDGNNAQPQEPPQDDDTLGSSTEDDDDDDVDLNGKPYSELSDDDIFGPSIHSGDEDVDLDGEPKSDDDVFGPSAHGDGGGDGEPNPEPPAALVKDMYVRLDSDKKEIRVVLLQPGAPDDPIRCEITNSELTRTSWPHGPYEAVSYTWAGQNGDNSYSTAVESNLGDIPITVNAQAVLRRVRLADRPRAIWMDQLCINQGDTAERNRQVSLMPEIYSNAAQVLICLVGVPLGDVAHLYHFGNIGERCLDIVKCPWFARVWVLQEVANAKKALVLGSDSVIDWETFQAAMCRWHSSSSSFTALPLPGALKVALRRRVPPYLLHDLLRDTRSCSAGDPRDKVFALFGILIQEQTPAYVADYTKPTETVYIETAREMIRSSCTLDVLLSCTSHRAFKSALQLPSWVPDWTLPHPDWPLRPQLSLPEWLRATYGGFAKPLIFGNPATPLYPSTQQPRELRVAGREVGAVTTTFRDGLSFTMPRGDPLVESYGHCNLDQFVAQWEPQRFIGDHFFGTGISVGYSVPQPGIGDEIWQLEGLEVLVLLRRVGESKKLIGECSLWGFTYHMCRWDGAQEEAGGESGCFCQTFLEIGRAPPTEITIV